MSSVTAEAPTANGAAVVPTGTLSPWLLPISVVLGAVVVLGGVVGGAPVVVARPGPSPTSAYATRRETGDLLDMLESVPEVVGGRPVVPGTDLPAWIVASMAQGGETLDDVMEAYPYLSRPLLAKLWPYLLTIPLERLQVPF